MYRGVMYLPDYFKHYSLYRTSGSVLECSKVALLHECTVHVARNESTNWESKVSFYVGDQDFDTVPIHFVQINARTPNLWCTF